MPGNLTTIERGAGPFNRPTRLASRRTATCTSRTATATPGSTASRPDGELIQSWGEPGTGPGQFNLPHSVWAHTNGEIWVCDRENDRIQIFGPTGELLRIWTNVTPPRRSVHRHRTARSIVGEMSWEKGETSLAGRLWPETRDARMTIRDIDGNVLTAWGEDDPCGPGGFSSPHGLWVDSKGNIYVARSPTRRSAATTAGTRAVTRS